MINAHLQFKRVAFSKAVFPGRKENRRLLIILEKHSLSSTFITCRRKFKRRLQVAAEHGIIPNGNIDKGFGLTGSECDRRIDFDKAGSICNNGIDFKSLFQGTGSGQDTADLSGTFTDRFRHSGKDQFFRIVDITDRIVCYFRYISGSICGPEIDCTVFRKGQRTGVFEPLRIVQRVFSEHRVI